MRGKPSKSGSARERRRSDLSVQIGKVARETRLYLGLTQVDIAERVGLTAEVYGRVERGDMLPSTPTLLRICAALGVSSDVLVGLASKDAASETLQSHSAPDEGLPPDMRRLMRLVRTMDEEQLAIFRGTAAGLLKLNKRRQQRKRDKTQGAIT